MEFVITLAKNAALQPKVTDLMPPSTTRWEAVQPTTADRVGRNQMISIYLPSKNNHQMNSVSNCLTACNFKLPLM
eukprot:11363602-Ditylum_brightwellii.AAC.1